MVNPQPWVPRNPGLVLLWGGVTFAVVDGVQLLVTGPLGWPTWVSFVAAAVVLVPIVAVAARRRVQRERDG